jgi:hypothetical protein
MKSEMKIEQFEIVNDGFDFVRPVDAKGCSRQMVLMGIGRGGLLLTDWDRVSVEIHQGLFQKIWVIKVEKADASATFTHSVGLFRWIGRSIWELETASYYAGRVMRRWLDAGMPVDA